MRVSFRQFAAQGLALTLLGLGGCASGTSAISEQERQIDPEPNIYAEIEVSPVLSRSGSISDSEAKTLWPQIESALEGNDHHKAYELLYRLSLEGEMSLPNWVIADRDPSHAIEQLMGMSAFAVGDYKKTLEHFENIRPDLNPHPDIFASDDLLPEWVLARIHLGLEEDPELALNAALEHNLEDERLWSALGRFYDSQQRWIEAQDTYIRAMSAGIDRAVSIHNLGVSLMLQGRYAEARDKFDQAMSLDPAREEFVYNWRLSFALTGHVETAIGGLASEKAAIFLNDAGVIAMGRGDKATAKSLLEQAMEQSPVYFETAGANLEALSALP